MQGEAIEAGGFKGRANKLVDGCYSWWVGGGLPVLEALLQYKPRGRKQKEANSSASQLFNNGQLLLAVISGQTDIVSSGIARVHLDCRST